MRDDLGEVRAMADPDGGRTLVIIEIAEYLAGRTVEHYRTLSDSTEPSRKLHFWKSWFDTSTPETIVVFEHHKSFLGYHCVRTQAEEVVQNYVADFKAQRNLDLRPAT